jgi:uroporphyrinogen decarboxylase
MNARERVLRAITFGQPDRIPIGYHLNYRTLQRHGEKLLDLVRRYHNDFYDPAIMTIPPRDDAHYRPDGSYYKVVTDEWGCEWVYYQEGIMGEVKGSPLADWGRLESYRIPPLPYGTPEKLAKLTADIAEQKTSFIGWHGAGSLFEQMQWLRGVEDLYMDIAMDSPEVYRLAERLVEEYLLPNVEAGLAAGADVIGFTDDWGSQQQLLINPEAWRRIFKPCYQRLYDRIHAGGALAWQHSDGHILEIVPDFIEIGLDVLNPQLGAMDLQAFADAAAGKVAIYGTLDYQRVLPYGTPEQVRAYVGDVTRALATPAGGFIYGAGIYGDVPFANIEAVFAAMGEWCYYQSPITSP